MTTQSRATYSAPASPAQERMWLLEQLESGAPAYNVQLGIRIRGRLDRVALDRAIHELVRRHEVLRSRLREADGGIVQLIESPSPCALRRASCADEAGVRAHASAELARPFDMGAGQPLRADLLDLRPDDHVLVITLDHLVCDAWSLEIVHREVTTLYAAFSQGRPSPLPELEIQYADYAVWQREQLESPDQRRQREYWIGLLGDEPERLDLGTGRRGGAPASISGTLPGPLVEALERLGRGRRTSLFMTLLAAFAALLRQDSGRSDLVVGTLLAGRPRPELEPLIGFFANTAAVRLNLSGDPSFGALLSRVRERMLDVYANQDVPFERIVEALRPRREPGRIPYIDVMFQLAAVERETVVLPDARIEPLDLPVQPAPVDLMLGMLRENGVHTMVWDYDGALLDAGAVERLQDRYLRTLEAAVADPDRELSGLDVIPAAERRLLVEWGGHGRPAPEGRPYRLHEVFEAAVSRAAEATAIEAGDEFVSYAEADARAGRLAAELRARGVGPEMLVGILMEPGVDAIVAVLAVLKAGAAYLPLDPAHPEERLAFVLADSAPRLVLTGDALRGRLPAHVDRLAAGTAASRPGRRDAGAASVAPIDATAYVIYTSGSTGRPKGVAVSHLGIAAIVHAQRALFALGPSDRVLQFSPLSFDASVFEMLAAFGAAATLVVAPAERRDPLSLVELMRERRVSFATLPPSALAAMPANVPLPALRTLTVAGEPCPPALAVRWLEGRRLFNLYGPTEATIWTTAHEVRAADSGARTLPIGGPIPGVAVRVLDAHSRAAPVGVPGELCIVGAVLARGYLGRPGLTAERFAPDPDAARPGARLYRTGDLVRWRGDGRLEFVGRLDGQVKLRGHRIELGEVEARLASHPAVAQAAAVVRDGPDLPASLVVYVVPRPGQAPPAGALREFCARVLPPFMVPSHVLVVDELPKRPNGKIDRGRLPAPGGEPGSSAAPAAPRTSLERLLAGVWADVLERDQVGVSDDFFQLGGHSLTATRVITRLRADYGLRLPARLLFDHPTLAGFAAAVVAYAAADESDGAGG